MNVQLCLNPSVLWNISDTDYFADHSAISNSMLNVALESMRRYHGMFVSHTIEPAPPSPEMVLGSLVHCMILEPDQVGDRWLIADCKVRSGREWQSALGRAESGGKTAVPEPVYEAAKLLADAVLADDGARSLIDAANLREQAIRWCDADTGLTRKAKIDMAILGPAGALIVDVKTTANPDPAAFARSCLDYGYHRQALTYSEGLAALTGHVAPVLFLCVGKKTPYDVAINQCGESLLTLARKETRDGMAMLRVAMEQGDWSSLWQRQRNLMGAPGWALKQAGIE